MSSISAWNEEMTSLTARIIAKTIFGKDLSDEIYDRVTRAVEQTQQLLVQELRFPPLKLINHIIGKQTRTQKILTEVKEGIYKMIQSRKSDSEVHLDLLQALMDARDEESGGKLSDREVLDEVATFFVAGHETSAHALSWYMFELGQNHDLQDKLYEECQTFSSLDSLANDKILRTPRLHSQRNLTSPPTWIDGR